jgi:hypothetical protein
MHPDPPWFALLLQNLTLELATMGDLKLVERLQQYTLAPGASKVIRANIKVGYPVRLPPPPAPGEGGGHLLRGAGCTAAAAHPGIWHDMVVAERHGGC